VGLAACVLACTSTGAALAIVPYTVHLTVPATVTKGNPFSVAAAGYSANLSQLTVFLDNRVCAKTSAREDSHPKAVKIITAPVVGNYTKTQTAHALILGTHHACAYLTAPPPAGFPRAHAAASYTVS
jgi:hypothetical protein